MMFTDRTELLIGNNNLEKIINSKIAVIGLGGVGSYAVEAIARSGCRNIIIADCDVVDETNINRQLIATRSVIGMKKTDVVLRRICDINPDADVRVFSDFVTEQNICTILNDPEIRVIDAIDTMDSKIALLEYLYRNDYKFISSMGAGGRINPEKVKIADISKTEYCPLAKKIRQELRARDIFKGIKTVYSSEQPILNPGSGVRNNNTGKSPIGSMPYIPAIFGLYCAADILSNIITNK